MTTVVKENPAPSPAVDAARQAHIDAMVAKADANKADPAAPPVAPAAPAAQRPEHIPEKFWRDGKVDVDGMAKAYATLEASRGKPADPPKVDAAPAAGSQDSVVAKAQAEFDTSGALSDETYAALEATGLSRDLVDGHIRNVSAVRLLAHTAAGGEDKYAEAVEWASDNYSAAEVEAFNAAVNATDAAKVLSTVKSLMERFNKRSIEPSLVQGQGGPASAVGYRSKAEMTKDMADPRYKVDPAFRAEVTRKVAAASPDVNLFM